MTQFNLIDIDNPYFTSAWKLYEEAFPVYERRTLKAQSHLLKNPVYKFDVFIEKNVFIGFIMWWDFKDFQYIDHFAVTKSKRNNGYGAKILKEIDLLVMTYPRLIAKENLCEFVSNNHPVIFKSF